MTGKSQRAFHFASYMNIHNGNHGYVSGAVFDEAREICSNCPEALFDFEGKAVVDWEVTKEGLVFKIPK